MKRLAALLLLLSLVLLGSSDRTLAQGQSAWAWGHNYYGQLGNGTTSDSLTPEHVHDMTGVVAMAGGWAHSLALRSDGTVWAWGGNWYGQLGDDTRTDRLKPVQVTGLTDVVTVSAGWDHGLALRSDGTVWAWGNNRYGQLGDGTNQERKIPVQVSELTEVVAVSAGGDHSLALRADGTVWTWGGNLYGQLGDGTKNDRNVPVQVQGLTAVIGIAGGGYHSLAVRSDGTVWAWGYNKYGQLGDGTKDDRTTPVQVQLLNSIVTVAGGGYHSLAVRSDGTVWAWGYNQYGQLGDGTKTDRDTPVQVQDLTGVALVAGGTNHSLALCADGTGWAWGHNGYGQLGDGTLAGSSRPVRVLGLVGIVAMAAGSHHSLAAGYADVVPTEISVLDCTGTITEAVTLQAYLRRASDSAPIPGKPLTFAIDGTGVGSAVTDSNGLADLDWTITAGPPMRILEASFAGDSAYAPSHGAAMLTAQSWSTKMATFDRMARVGAQTELKCRLVRSDNVPAVNKSINFSVDGTFVAAALTDSQGYARHSYIVPDGAGDGVRTILSEWVGNAGYAGTSRTAQLTVLKAIPYIWVLSRSVPQGQLANLYAYFRRLPDLQPQQGKTLQLSVDGTPVANVTTGTGVQAGVARYFYSTAGMSVGTYTVRFEFAGDAWIAPGSGHGTLTIN